MYPVQGSLCYNGAKFTIQPGKQTVGNCLLVDLEYKAIGESAEFAVLRIKNTGNTNSGQILLEGLTVPIEQPRSSMVITYKEI